MMHTDPPQHTRYRRLVQPGFKPSMVRLMEAGVTAKASALIGPIQGGETFDVVQDLSIPFPSAGDLRAARAWTGRSGPASSTGPRR